MRKLQLVHPRRLNSDAPRGGRGAAVSTERRYRYPAEEVWEVSEESWQVAERPYAREDRLKTAPTHS
jgi:hypothetical protein